jgi:DNA-directed RNA polymerase subunit M/transcription elongation factor TFIIS
MSSLSRNERRLRNIDHIQKLSGCKWMEAREIESACHVITNAAEERSYIDKLKQVCHNLKNNPSLKRGGETVLMSDSDMMSSDLERIEKHEMERRDRFEKMLNEKYEQVKDSSKATIRCRKCGSGEIQWDQKQTRGADEAMSIFCCCTKCKSRWTLK